MYTGTKSNLVENKKPLSTAMNTGDLPIVYAPNKLRIVIIFIVLRSFLDVSQNREGK